jgi:hypothetical protein
MADRPGDPDPDPYDKNNDFKWTEKAFELLSSGDILVDLRPEDGAPDTAVLRGPCPRCQHRLDGSFPLVAVMDQGTRKGPGKKASVPASVAFDPSCGCDKTHPGSPPGVTGCGVSFRIEFGGPSSGSA